MPTTKKLKIIHTEASPHWGGQEIRIFEEMKWFRQQGHEMILIAPSNGTLYKRCAESGFQVISIYFTKPRTILNIFKTAWIIWGLHHSARKHSFSNSASADITAHIYDVTTNISSLYSWKHNWNT